MSSHTINVRSVTNDVSLSFGESIFVYHRLIIVNINKVKINGFINKISNNTVANRHEICGEFFIFTHNSAKAHTRVRQSTFLSVSLPHVHRFLGDRNGSPYATRPLFCLSCLSVCNVGVLWPNGWISDAKRGQILEAKAEAEDKSLRTRTKTRTKFKCL